ncbi:HCP-like protein [Backusella circina FSU 941]|nr:HCP-like protein [Backusella circina FSU 941]
MIHRPYHSETLNWFNKVTDSRTIDAMIDIGRRYLDGNRFPQDNYVGFRWIRSAASAKLNEARRSVAKMYIDRDYIDQDYHKTSIWYMKAAKTRDNKAQYKLRLMYYHGLALQKDTLETSRWYTFTAEKIDSSIQCQLGILRERGEGHSHDISDSVILYNNAIKQKNPHAMFKLVRIYEDGSGVKNNFELVLKLFGISVCLGSLDSQLIPEKIYRNDSIQVFSNGF